MKKIGISFGTGRMGWRVSISFYPICWIFKHDDEIEILFCYSQLNPFVCLSVPYRGHLAAAAATAATAVDSFENISYKLEPSATPLLLFPSVGLPPRAISASSTVPLPISLCLCLSWGFRPSFDEYRLSLLFSFSLSLHCVERLQCVHIERYEPSHMCECVRVCVCVAILFISSHHHRALHSLHFIQVFKILISKIAFRLSS